MKTRYLKPVLIVIGAVLLGLLLLHFVPLRILALIPLLAMFLFVSFTFMKTQMGQEQRQERREVIPPYEPPHQQQPIAPIEYYQPTQSYQHGYQPPTSQGKYYEESSPLGREGQLDHEQPQAHYPEQ